jgi:hypothetical protein
MRATQRRLIILFCTWSYYFMLYGPTRRDTGCSQPWTDFGVWLTYSQFRSLGGKGASNLPYYVIVIQSNHIYIYWQYQKVHCGALFYVHVYSSATHLHVLYCTPVQQGVVMAHRYRLQTMQAKNTLLQHCLTRGKRRKCTPSSARPTARESRQPPLDRHH